MNFRTAHQRPEKGETCDHPECSNPAVVVMREDRTLHFEAFCGQHVPLTRAEQETRDRQDREAEDSWTATL